MASRKPVSETRRQANVFRYLAPNINLADLSAADLVLPPGGHVPRSSVDTALIAFAQLGAMRLKSDRAIVSLIDQSFQYILAEATPTSTLRSDAPMHTDKDKLWLGCARIPRSRSVCQSLLNINISTIETLNRDTIPAVVINDLKDDERYSSQWFTQEGLDARFYAGVPIVSPAGYIIGAFAVFNSSPRPGLSAEELLDLKDLAAVVMNHLHSFRLKGENLRSERMVKGLTSFVEGAKRLEASESEEENTSRSASPLDHGAQYLDAPTNHTNHDQKRLPPGPTVHLSTRDQSRAETAQEKILPSGTKRMFARAANIIRDTSELDGVVIFDAVIAAMPKKGFSDPYNEHDLPSTMAANSSTDESSSSSADSVRQHSISSLQSDSPRSRSRATSPVYGAPRQGCEVLGYATEHGASVDDLQAMLPKTVGLGEKSLKKLLSKFPAGRIFSFDASGEISSTEQSDATIVPESNQDTSSTTSRTRRRKKTIGDAIQKVAPGARSAAFVPLWDFDRGRWFAACLCWTTNSYRGLSERTDLTFVKAFGNSIMTELSRLDALAASKTKSNFASLMSHELRSPLHGILGGVQLLQDTQLDAFQGNMLGAIDVCGRTLLDTVDHLLDHAKINEYSKLRNGITSNDKSGKRNSNKSQTSYNEETRSLTSTIDLSLAVEEVVEAVFAGQSYGTISMRLDDEEMSRPQPTRTGSHDYVVPNILGSKSIRKPIIILFDIPFRTSWSFETQAGAWRRILINLFGNALKFTSNGYIKVTVRVNENSASGQTYVTMTVKDSGIGISSEYLLNRLYKPFSQENSFFSGTGLGLSIVRQLVDSLNGHIDIKSRLNTGTEVSVTLPLIPRPAKHRLEIDEYGISQASTILRDLKICIFESRSTEIAPADAHSISEMPVSRASSLLDTLGAWFHASGFITNSWVAGSADVIISTEPSFELLNSTRAGLQPQDKPPCIIFIAVDAIEASALRNDARILDSQSVIEIVTQPCGPHKLARALLSCLRRHGSALKTSDVKTVEQLTPVNANVAKLLPPQPSRTPSLEDGRAPQVMIVDDNQINRKLLVSLMKKLKMPFCEAVNGLEALEMYKEINPKIQVILMDLSMPIMDGMTATRQIRQYEQKGNLPSCKVIALTGLASQSTQIEARESGLDYFITKPARFEELSTLLPAPAAGNRYTPFYVHDTRGLVG